MNRRSYKEECVLGLADTSRWGWRTVPCVCGGDWPAMARAGDFRGTGEQEAWDGSLDAGTRDPRMLFQALGFNLQAKGKYCMFQRWKLT